MMTPCPVRSDFDRGTGWISGRARRDLGTIACGYHSDPQYNCDPGELAQICQFDEGGAGFLIDLQKRGSGAVATRPGLVLGYRALIGMALVFLWGCDIVDDPGPIQSRFEVRDSSGVTIATTPGEQARVSLGWEVAPEPDLTIGHGDAPSEYLTRVQGVRGLPEGHILVVDGGSAELRIYDSRGQLDARSGGEGEGPGEFLDPFLVPSPSGDSLVLFDRGIPRLQVFSVGGELGRTIPFGMGWPAGRVPPKGVDSTYALFEKIDGIDEVMDDMGIRRPTWQYFWYDLSSTEEKMVAAHPADWTFGSEEFGTLRIPFVSRPSAAVTARGAAISDGSRPEVREFDRDGHLLRVLRITESGRPVTSQMIERHLTLELAATPGLSRSQKEQEYDEVPIPDTLPVFSSLHVDSEGLIWAEVYGWDPADPTEWVIFGPDGRARGTVLTPAGLVVESIGEDFILGVWSDALDVESVRRYSLDRSESDEAERPVRGRSE